MENRKRKYVEDSFITIPCNGTGMQNLGDLWDCRNTTAVGMNLFGGSLPAANQVAYPRKNLHYALNHIKKTKDSAFTIGVGIEMSLTVLLVQINQSGTYENIKTTKLTDDIIEFTYNIETFSVKAANSASNFINDNVLRQISTKGSPEDLRATHACVEVVYGGQLTGKFVFEKTTSVTTEKENAAPFAKLALIPIKLAIKALSAGLGAIFGANKNNVTFTHTSDPKIDKDPKTVQDMLTLIDNLDDLIAKTKVGYISEYDVTGVKVRCIGAPLSSYLSPSILMQEEALKLYEEIEEDLKNSFLDMFMTLLDYQSKDFVKRQIADGSSNDRLRKILMDSENLVTIEINDRELELSKISQELMEIANAIFRKYRFGQKTTGDIEAVIEEFNQKFSATELFHEMVGFRNKVKEEYRAIDGNKTESVSNVLPPIVTFTNLSEAENWYENGNNNKVKILIQTAFETGKSGNFVRGFWELENYLGTYPILIGIAVPSIYNKNLIKIKISSQEKVYNEEKIKFLLEVLSLAVGKGNSRQSKIFHELNAALDGIILPLKPDNFSELNNLLQNLDHVRDTKICSSHLQLRDILSSADRQDRYQFVTTLEAEDTAFDAVRHLKLFRLMLSSRVPEAYKNSDWVIGDFGLFDYDEAPVVFFFKNNELLAICFDNLDLLILTEILHTSVMTMEEPDLQMLSPKQMDVWDFKWLYPNRVTFAKEVAKLYGYRFKELIEKNLESKSSEEILDLSENVETVDTIRFLRACLVNDNLQIISTAANCAVRVFSDQHNDISYILKKHGWDTSKGEFTFDFLQFEKELALLLNDLQSYTSTLSPFQAKILYYTKEMEKTIKNENYDILKIDKLIEEIINTKTSDGDLGLPLRVRQDLEGYRAKDSGSRNGGGWPLGESFQIKGVHNILDKYIAEVQRDSTDKEFYLKALTGLIAQISRPSDGEIKENNGEKGNEIEPFTGFEGLMDLALEYVSRLELSHEMYPLGKDKVAKHVANNEIFQALSILTRCKYNGYNYLILHEMTEVPALRDGLWMTQFVRKLGRVSFPDVKKPAYSILWENPKFKYLMDTVMDSESLLEALYIFQCEQKGVENIPKFFPRDFANRLREVAFQREDFNVDVAWTSIEQFSGYLQTMYSKGAVPNDLMMQMTRTFYTNDELREEAFEKGALLYWDNEQNFFTEPWDLETLLKAVDILEGTSGEEGEELQPLKYNLTHEKYFTNDTVEVVGPLTEFCGDSLPVVKIEDYEKLSEVINNPELSQYKTIQWMSLMIPFVLQRLRMGSIKEFLSDYYVLSPKLDEDEPKKHSLLARGEIQTCLMSTSDPEVILDILQRLSAFPVALPVVTQNISKVGNFLDFYHLLSQVVIKYMPMLESKPEELLKTRLFQGKPKIIVLAELGHHSTRNLTNRILKPLLSSKSKDFFSSETSLGVTGSVEMTWLTHFNCSEYFWGSMVKNFYTKDTKEPIILVKVHGDAIKNRAMKTLGQMASSIVVLLMPQEWEEMRANWKIFRDNLGRNYRNFVKVMIDPTESCLDKANEASKIQFDQLMAENEMEMGKLLSLFEEALLFKGKYPLPKLEFNREIIPKGNINNKRSYPVIPVLNSSLEINMEHLEGIFQHILELCPKLKVFVVSIFGFKSSGKSTLLNSLFGTNFGENTEGMTFQFSLLNDELKKKVYADAILVIDSQGLTSTETNRKSADRKLVSLVLSLSNMSIVNVMGGKMKELRNILAVGLVSQMRIKSAVENYPLMVIAEQTPAGKSDRASSNLAEFTDIVQKTIELCSERETDLGVRVRTSQRILNTIVNMKVWDVLKRFRRYGENPKEKIIFHPSYEYHEDVVVFYKIFLSNLKTAPAPIFFSDWITMLKNNHAVLFSQDFNFNSRFDNMDDLRSYFPHVDSFRTVKDNYDNALRVHQFKLEEKFFKDEEMENKELQTLIQDINGRLQMVPDICEEIFSRDGTTECDGNIEKCLRGLEFRDRVFKTVQGLAYQPEFETRLTHYRKIVSEHILHQIVQKIIVNKMKKHINGQETRRIDMKKFLDLFFGESDYETLEKKPQVYYAKYQSLVAARNLVIPAYRLYYQEVAMEYEFASHLVDHLGEKTQLYFLPQFENLPAFDVEMKDSGVLLTWAEKEWLQKELDEGAQEIYFYSRDSLGDMNVYEIGMARKWRLRIDEIIDEFESKCRKTILIDFRWTVHEYGVKLLGQYMAKLQDQWDARYLPLSILLDIKDDFFHQLEIWLQQ